MKANWIALLFIRLTDISSRLRQKLWRWIYNKIVSRDKLGNFVFMNYGYLNTDDKFLLLEPTDEPHRLFIQLYDFVVNDISLQDKDIIEVGCGRGGGGAS